MKPDEKDVYLGTSGQDGDVDRHALPPCTTIERITTPYLAMYNVHLCF